MARAEVDGIFSFRVIAKPRLIVHWLAHGGWHTVVGPQDISEQAYHCAIYQMHVAEATDEDAFVSFIAVTPRFISPADNRGYKRRGFRLRGTALEAKPFKILPAM
ncbi:hypothetical protein RRG08_031248 [Elysia crispata]|uniref:Uncharacterized protein n=1 Tax=Elysia crispata TaxID=231223 RepID=A0AAE1AKZ5_9GAST|nr:hypothetical protein RRG08_031248 [Elysia crispata]